MLQIIKHIHIHFWSVENDYRNRLEAVMSSAWSDRAEELADWTIAHLVMRWDRHGIYFVGDGKKRLNKRTGKMEVRYKKGEDCSGTSHRELTRGRIIRHYRATERNDVIGLHPIAWIDGKSVGTWGCHDIDRHK